MHDQCYDIWIILVSIQAMKFPLKILMMLVLDRNYNNPAMIGYKVGNKFRLLMKIINSMFTSSSVYIHSWVLSKCQNASGVKSDLMVEK